MGTTSGTTGKAGASVIVDLTLEVLPDDEKTGLQGDDQTKGKRGGRK
jgi:hypothetical protein